MSKKVKEESLVNDEIKVRICNELSIKDKPWYSIFKDIKFWIPTIISLVAVIISLIPYIQHTEIDGKISGLIISGYMNYPYTDINGASKTIEGIGYTMNVLIAVRNKNFIFKNFDIYIKYYGEEKKHKGEVIPANDAILDYQGIKKRLRIPVEEQLLYTNVLEKEKVNSYFVRFIIDKSAGITEELIKNIEEVEIKFFDYSGKSLLLCLKMEDPRRMTSFADKYWEKVN